MAIRTDDVGHMQQFLDRRRSSRPRRRATCSLAGCLATSVLVLVGMAGGQASAESLDENQLKAAYLYNFARYVEWPSGSHRSKRSPLKIGVVGGGAVSDLLRKTVVDKKVGDRLLEIVDVASHTEARDSHILFIPGAPSATDLEQVVDDMNGTHVFVVADAEEFAEHGGIANFIVSDNRVKFAINQSAARRAGLKVSSKLLRLAELID